VLRALDAGRERRHQTAHELATELDEVARELRLDASQLGLSRWMHALFADDLAGLAAAQRAGRSLADHVVLTRSMTPTASATSAITRIDGGRPTVTATAPEAPAPPPSSARRSWPIAVGAAAAIALLVAIPLATTREPPPRTSGPAVETAPTPATAPAATTAPPLDRAVAAPPNSRDASATAGRDAATGAPAAPAALPRDDRRPAAGATERPPGRRRRPARAPAARPPPRADTPLDLDAPLPH
jgi:hypothetical protein